MEHERVHELTAAYALHALEPEEERAFEAHLSRCPECREEVASFRDAASALAYGAEAPAPPPALRERILERARSERANVVPLRPRWAYPAAAAAALAATVALALAVWNLSLSRELATEREARGEQAEVYRVSGGQGRLVVTAGGNAVLILSGLEPAPPGRTYEAWVIEEGEPQPAGLFPGGGNPTAVALTRPVPEGAIVAVTIEPAGGAARPTAKPILTARVV